MPKYPKLSIVIPSYNQGAFIERTIRSIVEQKYPDLELILMDGGSTDGTMAVVEKYRQHFSHIQSGKDGGQSAAIRAGFERATGDYVSWLNSDDTYNPGALLAVGDYLIKNPQVRFVYGDVNYIDAEDQIIAHKPSAKFVLGIMKYAFLTVPQMSAFWQRSLYEAVGGVDKNLRFCMDYDLFVRMATVSAPRNIPVTVGNFRLHPASKTKNLDDVRAAEDKIVQTRYCAVKPANALQFKIVRGFYTVILMGLFLRNGSLLDRLRMRIRLGGKSAAS